MICCFVNFHTFSTNKDKIWIKFRFQQIPELFGKLKYSSYGDNTVIG